MQTIYTAYYITRNGLARVYTEDGGRDLPGTSRTPGGLLQVTGGAETTEDRNIGGVDSPPLTIAPQGRRSHFRLWGQGLPVRSARKVPISTTEERHKTNVGQGSPKKPTRHGNEKRGTETSGDGYAHGRALFDAPARVRVTATYPADEARTHLGLQV